MKNTILTLLTILFLASACVFNKNYSDQEAQNLPHPNGQPTFELFKPIDAKAGLEKVVTDAQFFQLDKTELQKIYEKQPINFTLQLPDIKGLPGQIHFNKKEVTTSDLVIKDQSGQSHSVQAGIHYRQIETGEMMAAISIFEGRLTAMITTKSGDYSISELTDSPGDYILFSQNNLVEQADDFTCTPLYPEGYKMPKYAEYSQHSPSHAPAGPDDPVIRVYVECDWDMYDMNGGTVQGVYEYVTTLFNLTATIYEAENIALQLSEMMVWTNSDPYNVQWNQALGTFVTQWQEADYTFNGDLAHLLRGYATGGLAWVDVVCDSDLPFGMSGMNLPDWNMFPNFIYQVYVFTHELGHNLGSPHTHNCSWGPNNDEALDNCAAPEGDCDWGPTPADGGTIMSYCSGFILLNGLGQEPGDLVRMILAQKTCLETVQFYADCQMDSITIATVCEANPTPNDPTDDLYAAIIHVKGAGSPNTLQVTDLASGQTWMFSHNVDLAIGPFTSLEGQRFIRIEDLSNPACTTERAIFPSSDCFRPDQCAPFVWENSLGGGNSEDIFALSAYPSGGFAVAGRTTSDDGDFSPSQGVDIFVQKVDATGNTLWLRQFGGENTDEAYDVLALDDGGALVVGLTYSSSGFGTGQKGGGDAFALRLDANGNQVWKRLYGGSSDDRFQAILQLPSGDFVFAGMSWSNNGDVSGNQGSADYWLLRASGNGDIVWSKLYGNNLQNGFESIEFGHGNTLAMAGSRYQQGAEPYYQPTAAEVTFDGDLNWEKTYPTSTNDRGVSLLPNDNGGYLYIYQNDRPYLARLAPNGDLVESWRVANKVNSYFQDAVKLSDNRIAVGGWRNGQPGVPETDATSRDFWLYLMNGDGHKLFEKTYGPHRADFAGAITATPDGGYVLGGRRETFFESNTFDTWLVKFGPDICTQEGACYLTTQTYLVECDDNGTISDLSDDVFTFDLIVNQAGDCGSGWTDGTVTSQYGLLTAMGPYPISGGPKTLVITDLDDPSISITVTVDPPEPCSYGPTYCDENLLENPGFETGWNPLAYWQTEGDVSVSDNPFQDEYAAQICDGTGNITQVHPAIPGQEYTASAWVKKESASTGPSYFTLRFLTSSWMPLSEGGYVFNNTDYQQIVQTKTAPNDAAYVQVLLWKEAGGCVETDNWELCEGSVAQPCEIVPELTEVGCSDNNTPNDPSDDTFQFYFIVNNSGQGATYSVFIPETGFTQSGGYGWPYVYGGFEISEGPITVIFTDNDDPNCTATLTVTPPPPCSGDLPDFELKSFIAAQWTAGGNPQIQPYDEVVAGTEIYFPDHFANLDFPNPMPTFDVTIAAYLSPDEVLNGNDPLLTSGTRTIDANVQTWGFTEGGFGGNYQIPLSTTPGEYYLIVKYDSENLVTETNEANNTLSIPFFVTSGTTGNIDLELSLAQPNQNPPIYSNYEVTATLTNAGPEAATGVEVSFAKPAGVVYTGGNEFTASQGIFDPLGTQVWSVGSIPAGGTATLTVHYFLLQSEAPTAYAQVGDANEPDLDSTPGNGTPPTPNEDDEASTGGGGDLGQDFTCSNPFWNGNEACPGNPVSFAVMPEPGGGSGNYGYLWSDGQTTSIASNLEPGTYTVTVTDLDFGCTCVKSVTGTGYPIPFSVELSVVQQPSSPTANDGVIQAEISTLPSLTPYTFTWSNGTTVQSNNSIETLDNLAQGLYSVTVTSSAFSCENIDEIELTATTGGQIDLELSLAQPNATPQIYSSYEVTATLTNVGGETATGVQVSFAKPAGVVYTGGNEFTASQGTFNPNGDETWMVGSIPAGGSATLTVSYFLLQTGAPGAYAQVIAANEQDVDSTPGNGTPPAVNEDDEASTSDSPPPDLKADLTLSDLTVNNSPIEPGHVLTYNFTIANIGDGPASADFNVKAWISTNPYVTATSIQDGIVPTGNYPAGFSVEGVPGASTLPGDLAEGQYYLIVEVDADEAIEESNEFNNTLSTTFIVLDENQPGDCDQFVGTGVVNCLEQDGTGQLEILYQPNGELYRSTLDGTGQVISDEFLGGVPPVADYRVELGNELVKLVGSNEEYRIAIPQALLDQYSAITAHTEFQGGYLLFGYIANNAPPTQLEIIHTDLNFNLLQTTSIPYAPNLSSPYVLSPQPVSTTEAAFLLSVNSSIPGLASLSLIVIDDNLNLLTNEVLRDGVFYNTGSLLPDACGTYTLRVNTGLNFCKFGPCNELNIRKGRFVNGQFVTEQSYFTRHLSSFGYGEITQSWSLATLDGGEILGVHLQSLLPTGSPTNNVIHLEKYLDGALEWEKDVTVSSAANVRWLGQSVDELVFLSEKIGGVFVESLSCLESSGPPTGGVDLELTMSTSNETPSIYTDFTIATTILNTGTEPASGVRVSVPKPTGVVYVGGTEWTATQGVFSPFGNEEWTVGNLAPGQSATLMLNYFLLTPNALTTYAQVSALNETDVDSSPGNGTPPTPIEDDEAAVTINAFAGGTGQTALGQQNITGRPVQLMAVNPNPVYFGEIYLTILSKLEGSFDLECYDLAGRMAFIRRVELRQGWNNLPLDVRTLESGSYYLNMRGENWRGMPLRFVVARW